MTRVNVTSSNIVSIGYHEDILEVEFKGGRVYHYAGVPFHLHASIMCSPSKGKALNSIKDSYPCARIA